MDKIQEQILKNQLLILRMVNNKKHDRLFYKAFSDTKNLIYPNLKEEDLNACEMEEFAICEVSE